MEGHRSECVYVRARAVRNLRSQIDWEKAERGGAVRAVRAMINQID